MLFWEKRFSGEGFRIKIDPEIPAACLIAHQDALVDFHKFFQPQLSVLTADSLSGFFCDQCTDDGAHQIDRCIFLGTYDSVNTVEFVMGLDDRLQRHFFIQFSAKGGKIELRIQRFPQAIIKTFQSRKGRLHHSELKPILTPLLRIGTHQNIKTYCNFL